MSTKKKLRKKEEQQTPWLEEFQAKVRACGKDSSPVIIVTVTGGCFDAEGVAIPGAAKFLWDFFHQGGRIIYLSDWIGLHLSVNLQMEMLMAGFPIELHRHCLFIQRKFASDDNPDILRNALRFVPVMGEEKPGKLVAVIGGKGSSLFASARRHPQLFDDVLMISVLKAYPVTDQLTVEERRSLVVLVEHMEQWYNLDEGDGGPNKADRLRAQRWINHLFHLAEVVTHQDYRYIVMDSDILRDYKAQYTSAYRLMMYLRNNGVTFVEIGHDARSRKLIVFLT